MTDTEKQWSIFQIEEFYCNRMEHLVNNEKFDDAHCIFEEFVVNDEEPEEYMFMAYHGEL